MFDIGMMSVAVALWWVGNAIATIASKSIMNEKTTSSAAGQNLHASWTPAFEDLRWLELTTLQHLLGAVAGVIYLKIVVGRSAAIWPTDSQRSRIYIAAMANVVGNLSTNAAYALVSSSAAQVVKSCEPIFTFVLSLFLYKNYDDLNVSTLFSIVIMIVGACTFVVLDSSFKSLGLFAAICSNIGFATRNIFLKKLSWENPIQKFSVISICSTVLLLPPVLLKLIFNHTHTIFSSGTKGSLTSAIAHFTYNAASITVLQEVTPLTHAILNLSKRVFVIIANLAYFHTHISLNMLMGLLIFFAGLVLYQFRGKKFDKRKVYGFAIMYFALTTLVWFQGPSISSKIQVHLHDTVPVGRSTKLRSSESNVITAWAYDRTLPPDILTNIKGWYDKCSGVPIHVYCGTSQCKDAIIGLNNPSITTEFLVASDLVSDTPLEQWLARHPLNKVLAGLEFEDHLQRAVQLGILWKHGGVYIDPMVRMTGDSNFQTTCENGWIGKGEKNSMLDVSCFPKQHLFIRNVAEQFVSDYPKEGSVHSAFHFNFSNVMKTAREDYCHGDSCFSSHVDDVVRATTSILEGHHFGTLSFDTRVKNIHVANLGDEIQGFPGIQFLPFVDHFLERDKLRQSSTNEPVTVFFNAWWGDKRMRWPPPSNVDPVMTSLHIKSSVQGMWTKNIKYLEKYSPIGSRDIGTLQYLKENHIDTYFSACLTLMIKNPNVGKHRTDKIYLVDVKQDTKKLLPQEIQDRGIDVQQNSESKDSLERFTTAYELLESYASAKLVVTQRIHCALPCVAMGIPVIFINSPKMPGGGGSKAKSSPRTVGLTPMFHTADLYTVSLEEAKEWLHNFDWNNPPPNPNVATTMRLRATFWNVIRQRQALYDAARKFGMIPLPHPPHDTEQGANKQLLFHLIFTTSVNSTIQLWARSGSAKVNGVFNWRHWRTVESIFHHHPFAKVIIHSNVLYQSEFDVLTEAGYSIEVQKYDLKEMLKGSPAESFTSKLQGASEGYSHETDLLRLLFLYNHGGIYMDADVIVVKPVDSLRNVLAWQDPKNGSVNGAFMAFEKGNKFLRDCLTSFATEYRGEWTFNGLLTRVWKKWKNGPDVVALKNNAFYPFHYSEVESQCFKNMSTSVFDERMKIVKEESYAVHLNSKITGHKGIGSDDKPLNGTICKYLLNEFCIFCNNQY